MDIELENLRRVLALTCSILARDAAVGISGRDELAAEIATTFESLRGSMQSLATTLGLSAVATAVTTSTCAPDPAGVSNDLLNRLAVLRDALQPFALAYRPLSSEAEEDPSTQAMMDRNTITPPTSMAAFRRAHEAFFLQDPDGIYSRPVLTQESLTR